MFAAELSASVGIDGVVEADAEGAEIEGAVGEGGGKGGVIGAETAGIV